MVKFSKQEQEDFNFWMKDGNVSKNSDGSYSTQDAQFGNKLKDMDALKEYYFKEFLSGSQYAGGGTTSKSKVLNVRARGGFKLEDFNPLLDYYDELVSYKKVGKLQLNQIVGKNHIEDKFEFNTEKDRDYWYDILTEEQEKYFTIKNKKKFVNYIFEWHDPYSEKAEDEGITKKSEMLDYFADEIYDELRHSTDREYFITNLDLQNKFADGGEIKVNGMTKNDYEDAYNDRVAKAIKEAKKTGEYDADTFDLWHYIEEGSGFTANEIVGWYIDYKTFLSYWLQNLDNKKLTKLDIEVTEILCEFYFGKPMFINISISTGGDLDLALEDELQKIKLLSQKIDFNKVVGVIDYEKADDNTDLDFYKGVELIMSVNGDWNEETEELDTLISLVDGENAELNYHPLDSMGGVNFEQLEKNINEAFRELNTYSAVVSIEGYEEYAEDVEGLENARAVMQNIKGNTRFQVLKGSSVGVGKLVDVSRVVEEFANGGEATFDVTKLDLDNSISSRVYYRGVDDEINKILQNDYKPVYDFDKKGIEWVYKNTRYESKDEDLIQELKEALAERNRGVVDMMRINKELPRIESKYGKDVNLSKRMYQEAKDFYQSKLRNEKSDKANEIFIDYLISRLKENKKDFANGGEVGKGYNVFNYTDNIYATDEVFKTKKLANDFIKEFRNRFSRQGYYRDNQMNKIAVEDIDLLAIPSDFNPFGKYADGGRTMENRAKKQARKDIKTHLYRPQAPYQSVEKPSEEWERYELPYDTKMQYDFEPDSLSAQDKRYSEFAEGGEAGFDDAGTSMVMYHEKRGNFIIPKGQIYLWLYEGEKIGEKLQNQQYDWVFYPLTSINMAFQSGYIPPLKRVWTKKFQKEHKGSEHLLGLIKAYLIEKEGEKELFIDMMSVNPNNKKEGIMSYMIKDLRDAFNLSQDQVTFSKLTKEGEKFIAKKQYSDGGGIGDEGKLKFEDLVGKYFEIELGSSGTSTEWESKELLAYLKKVVTHNLFDSEFYYNWTDSDEKKQYLDIFTNDTLNEIFKNVTNALNKYFEFKTTAYSTNTKVLVFKYSNDFRDDWIDNWFKTNKKISVKLKVDYKRYREKYAGVTPYAYGGGVEPNIYFYNDGEQDITFTTFEEAYNEVQRLGYSKFRDNLGGEYFVNKDLTKKTIYQHKSNPYITLEFLEDTNKGIKGLQKNPKSLSKKERTDGIIVYYSDSEMKQLFDKKYSDGGGVEPYDEEKYSSEYDYLKKIITKNFGEKNTNYSSADWGGIDNWTIKGGMYEGVFIIIDDNRDVILMERKYNEELEENEDTDILYAEVNDKSALQKLFNMALQIKYPLNTYADGGETEEDKYGRGGFMYEVQKKGSPSNDMRETMFTAKNLTELKKKIIEKYGTSEGFLVSRRTEQGYYAPVKFEDGGSADGDYIGKMQRGEGYRYDTIYLPKDLKEEVESFIKNGYYDLVDDGKGRLYLLNKDGEIGKQYEESEKKEIQTIIEKFVAKGKYANGGGVGEFPPKGELTNKDNFLLKYEKKGSDYEFFVYKPITKEVSGYNQIKHVCLNKDCPQKMTYEQFINYLYVELYLDDNKYAEGGDVGELNIGQIFEVNRDSEKAQKYFDTSYGKGYVFIISDFFNKKVVEENQFWDAHIKLKVYDSNLKYIFPIRVFFKGKPYGMNLTKKLFSELLSDKSIFPSDNYYVEKESDYDRQEREFKGNGYVELIKRKINPIWKSIIDKFSEIYFSNETDNDYLVSDQVKARGSNPYSSYEFRNFSPLLSWADAEGKFKQSLTADELNSIEISYNTEEYADLEEHDTEKYHKQIVVKLKKFADGGGVGEPYDSMTKYQIEKEYKKLNEKRGLLIDKYGDFESDEILENEKEIDKIITLLYGKNFSGNGQKFRYADGGLTRGEIENKIEGLRLRIAKTKKQISGYETTERGKYNNLFEQKVVPLQKELDTLSDLYGKSKYEKGGAIYPDLSLIKADVVNDSVVLDEFEIKKTKNTFTINGLENKKIKESSDIVRVLRNLWDKDTINAYEQSYVLYLNKSNNVIGYYHHSSGGIDGTIMDVQMISGMALKSLAKGVIIAHNHPSESTLPSDADKRITNQIKDALKVFNILLLDSIIITDESYFSFCDEGLI